MLTALLSLNAPVLVANLAGIAVCLIVMVVCICRVNVTQPKVGRISMLQGMYVCFAFWAMGTMLLLMQGQLIGFHNAAVGLGILLHLRLSYRNWEPVTWGRRTDDRIRIHAREFDDTEDARKGITPC